MVSPLHGVSVVVTTLYVKWCRLATICLQVHHWTIIGGMFTVYVAQQLSADLNTSRPWPVPSRPFGPLTLTQNNTRKDGPRLGGLIQSPINDNGIDITPPSR